MRVLVRSVWLLLLLAAPIHAATAQPLAANRVSPYIRVSLPRGVSVELPRNWTAISGHSRLTMEAAVTAMLGGNDVYENSNLPFAANLYDDRQSTIGIFNIRYYPDFEFGQADVRGFTKEDLSTLDATMKTEMQNMLSANGMSVLSWRGTEVIELSGKQVLITEYRRSGQGNSGPFRVRLVRFIDGPRSFTITISYAERLALLLKPITDYVIASIRA